MRQGLVKNNEQCAALVVNNRYEDRTYATQKRNRL